ncbi:hypothetical protein [Spiroplasma culicicola]|uniref:Uncharacterized protein n=1 Tax=Spiroplasma culicicola AES-1 TaxID=1276246 RepID=W6A6T0_9MOLU|nr:hypothetical protein [Spiroplasma culicicola]AHI52818.1 hypothetical protein SCULI_v1c04770 [Spiroplasma culicicola AES-1]
MFKLLTILGSVALGAPSIINVAVNINEEIDQNRISNTQIISSLDEKGNLYFENINENSNELNSMYKRSILTNLSWNFYDFAYSNEFIYEFYEGKGINVLNSKIRISNIDGKEIDTLKVTYNKPTFIQSVEVIGEIIYFVTYSFNVEGASWNLWSIEENKLNDLGVLDFGRNILTQNLTLLNYNNQLLINTIDELPQTGNTYLYRYTKENNLELMSQILDAARRTDWNQEYTIFNGNLYIQFSDGLYKFEDKGSYFEYHNFEFNYPENLISTEEKIYFTIDNITEEGEIIGEIFMSFDGTIFKEEFITEHDDINSLITYDNVNFYITSYLNNEINKYNIDSNQLEYVANLKGDEIAKVKNVFIN